MKSRILFTLIFVLPLIGSFFGCDQNSKNEQPEATADSVARDLPQIREDGKLRVLLSYSSTSYFLYRGKPMGFEYELLQRLAKDLDLKLKIILVNNMDSVFQYINEGKADMVAHGLTITTDRKEKVAFSDYLYLTKQVLVQKKPDNWRKMGWANVERHLLHDAIDLLGDTISVRENTSYIKRISNLGRELGGTIYVDTLPGTLSTEEIIEQVANGEIKQTVADKNLAQVSATYHPILNIDVPLSMSQRIAWVVRKNSPELLAAINEWIKKEKKGVDYYVIYNRYFKNKRDFRRRIRSEFHSLNSNSISKYDDLIQKYSKKIGWDWRLVASLIYQESRFKNTAKSWAGAEGLMQLMPETATSLGVNNPRIPEQSIMGGTKYLKKRFEQFSEVKDTLQRKKLTMAAYNCGFYHVKDARFLAEKNGLDPNVWDGNVEKMVLALSNPETYNQPGVKYGYVRGLEPVTYVRQIFERYEHYKKFIEI